MAAVFFSKASSSGNSSLRWSLFAIILFAGTAQVSAQYIEQPSRWSRTGDHIISSITEMTDWYDIPIGLVFYTKLYHFYSDPANKPFRVYPFDFEHDLASTVGVSGSKSIGDADPNAIVRYIILGRTAYALGQDLLTEQGSSQKSYMHVIGLYKAVTYTEVATNITKELVYKNRPDESDTKSFFSGHSSMTFAMSSFIHREVDDAIMQSQTLANSPGWRTAARIGAFSMLYGWAGYVGYSRMRDQKHYLVDVLLGAAIGTFVGNFVYDTWLSDGDSVINSLAISSHDGTPCLGIHMTF